MEAFQPENAPEVQKLFSGLHHHLAVAAILSGEVDAPVWVNNRQDPGLVFTRTRQRCFLAGDPQNSASFAPLKAHLEHTIIPQLIGEGYSVFILFSPPDGWLDVVPELFPSKKTVLVARQHYFRAVTGDLPLVRVPDGFVLRTVDAALLAEVNLENMDALREEMCSERASVDEFLQKSFGVVALHQNTLAGWCLSEYNTGGSCEVGIGTQEPFRRQGLAMAMGSAFLLQAQRHGINQVGWDCFADNIPSVTTARRLGFEKVADYSACLVWL